MKKKVITLLKKNLNEDFFEKLRKIKHTFTNIISLSVNTFIDFKLYCKYSMVFKVDNLEKIESWIILHYHGIEKGFIHEKFKFRFGQNRIIELKKLLKNEIVKKNYKKSQIASAYLSMCKYYEKHQEAGIDISDYYSNNDYNLFKNFSTIETEIIKKHNENQYFNYSNNNFFEFAKSRCSVRNYSNRKISMDLIREVIELAKTAPSVCNRQPTKIYYIENKDKINRIFDIQKGLKGFSNEINQLFILVSDRNYFYSIGERNQLYIDGGIFLMNLLYALHYYKIGACPAHWALGYKQDKQIAKELKLKGSEKVICLIPIGFPKNEFTTTLSLRRDSDEILKIVD